VCYTTGLALACCIVGDWSVRVVVFVFWRCGRGMWLWGLSCGCATRCCWLRGRCGRCECGSVCRSSLGFFGRCVVYGAVFAGCAWRNGHELVKGQDAWFAAFPALLSFVEDWLLRKRLVSVFCSLRATVLGGTYWTRMVYTFLIVVCKGLAAALVHAFTRHDSLFFCQLRG
jgi:hypothetical protein